jgi:hypothetical protein
VMPWANQETSMDQPMTQPPPAQQKLAFARDETWGKLPSTTQAECVTRLVQMLHAVMIHERETRRDADERQDSI